MESVRAAGSEQKRGQKTDQGCRAGIKRAADQNRQFGIVSIRCQNGKIIDRWEIKYTNPDDAKKVQDFLGKFDKDANLTFSGSKDFWEEFLKK